MIEVDMSKYKKVLDYFQEEHYLNTIERYIKENQEQKEQINNLQMQIEQLKSSNPYGAGRKPKLSEADREKVKLYRINGKSLNEIAEIFKCSTKTIQRILKA